MKAELPPDFADLLVALVEAGAEFLIVGGYAGAVAGAELEALEEGRQSLVRVSSEGENEPCSRRRIVSMARPDRSARSSCVRPRALRHEWTCRLRRLMHRRYFVRY